MSEKCSTAMDTHLRQMECTLAFFDRDVEPFAEHVPTAVVWQFEVIDVCHYTGKVVVWRVGWLAGTADDREDRGQTLEAYVMLVESQTDGGKSYLQWEVLDFP